MLFVFQLHSKHVICKRWKGLCDAIEMEKKRNKENEEQMKKRTIVMKDYLRAVDLLVQLRERLGKMQENTSK